MAEPTIIPLMIRRLSACTFGGDEPLVHTAASMRAKSSHTNVIEAVRKVIEKRFGASKLPGKVSAESNGAIRIQVIGKLDGDQTNELTGLGSVQFRKILESRGAYFRWALRGWFLAVLSFPRR